MPTDAKCFNVLTNQRLRFNLGYSNLNMHLPHSKLTNALE